MKIFKVFWILLFLSGSVIPLFHMNTEQITEQENRGLAQFPEVKKNEKINTDYGKEFESWLGDRFWGRNKLIDARFQMLYKINGRIENEKAFIGDDGWMFKKWNTIDRPPIERQRKKIEADAEILKKFADKFKEKNIPIYLVLIPERELVYSKYWENYYNPKPVLDYGNEMIKHLSSYSNIKVIYPKKEFEDASHGQELLFWKDDSHLTNYGTYIMLTSLFKTFASDQQISTEPVFFKKAQKQEKHVAEIAATLGLPGKTEIDYILYFFRFENIPYHQTEEKLFFQVQENLWEREGILYRSGEVSNASFDKKLISIGSCYSEKVFHLLNKLFRYSEWIRTNMGLSYGEDAKKHNVAKIKQLFDLQPDSAIIIITHVINRDPLEYIAEALNN